MPAVSIAQQHLMQAAEHGADFPMAEKLRESMSHDQLHDFAVGPMVGKPEHVGGGLIGGEHVGENIHTLMGRGASELDATKNALRLAASGRPRKPRHQNLGKFLHPRKDGKPHGSGF